MHTTTIILQHVNPVSQQQVEEVVDSALAAADRMAFEPLRGLAVIQDEGTGGIAPTRVVSVGAVISRGQYPSQPTD